MRGIPSDVNIRALAEELNRMPDETYLDKYISAYLSEYNQIANRLGNPKIDEEVFMSAIQAELETLKSEPSIAFVSSSRFFMRPLIHFIESMTGKRGEHYLNYSESSALKPFNMI